MSTPPSKRARDLEDATPKSGRAFTSITQLLDQRFAEQTKRLQGMLQSAKVELVSTMNNHFDLLRRSHYALSEKVKKLEVSMKEFDLVKTELNTVKAELNDVKSELQDLRANTSKLENIAVASELRIHGVPIKEQENLTDVFNNICVTVGVTAPAVQNIRRLNATNNGTITDGPILVKLSSPYARNLVLKSIAAFRRENKMDLNLSLIGYQSSEPVYVNEHLTRHNHTILKAALKLKKQRKIYAAYTRRGIVYIKHKKDDNAMPINLLNQLSFMSNDDGFRNDAISNAPAQLSTQSHSAATPVDAPVLPLSQHSAAI